MAASYYCAGGGFLGLGGVKDVGVGTGTAAGATIGVVV